MKNVNAVHYDQNAYVETLAKYHNCREGGHVERFSPPKKLEMRWKKINGRLECVWIEC